MKIKWIHNKYSSSKVTRTTKDISNFVESFTWSGSKSEACRTLEITVLNSPLDKNIPDLDIKVGDRLKLLSDSNVLLIDAMIYTREIKDEQGTVSYTAYDDLRHIVNSNLRHKYKNTTPERIARSVCKELGVSAGNIVKTKVPIKKLIIDGGGYETIMKAYTKAHKENGKKYMPLMVGRKLSVLEKGDLIDNFYLRDTQNVISASYTQSIEDMINIVKIFSEKGKCLGTVRSKNSITKYGKFQEVYEKEDGVNPKKAAKSLLQGMTKEASIEAVGNMHCISGYAVKISDSESGLVGKYWIESDSHTWQDGEYTMQLDLEFKNLMDTQEDDQDSTSSKKNKNKKGNKASKNKCYIAKSSKTYHQYSKCSGLQGALETTIDKAKQQGKIKCKKCWK